MGLDREGLLDDGGVPGTGPDGPRLHALRAASLRFREVRATRAAGDGYSTGRGQRASQARADSRIEQDAERGRRRAPTAEQAGEMAEVLLRDPGGRVAADLHSLHERSRADPLFLPSIPGEQAARDVRVHRNGDQDEFPRAGRRAITCGAHWPALPSSSRRFWLAQFPGAMWPERRAV